MFQGASAFASSVTYDGITFADGDLSFADTLIAASQGNPAATSPTYVMPTSALGAPDHVEPNGAYSLGNGGSTTLGFVDNALIASGDPTDDLHIFEIGSDVEATFVFVSTDGINFLSVGSVAGATSGVDIDPFVSAAGLPLTTQFAFVRLIDDITDGMATGATVGADIDAVGAISSTSVTAPVPLPASGAFLLAAFGFLGLRRIV